MSIAIGEAPVPQLADHRPFTMISTDCAWCDQKRLVLVEYNPGFCALLRDRYPHAKVVQGDAYALRDSLWEVLKIPASAVVSGLPLVTKPMLTRLKLIRDAFAALAPGAPFVQFTIRSRRRFRNRCGACPQKLPSGSG